MKWHKRCPRKSGYYFVSFDVNEQGRVYDVMEVVGRDAKSFGYVFVPCEGKYSLDPGHKDEFGDMPIKEWALWEWAGPIMEPKDE